MNDPSIQLLEKFRALQRRLEHLETLETLAIIPWNDYSGSSTFVGWSAGTLNASVKYKLIGKLLFCQYNIYGTSNNATTTFTLPYISLDAANMLATCAAQDNGAIISNAVAYGGNPNIQFYKDWNGTAFTASGAKRVWGQFFYETA